MDIHAVIRSQYHAALDMLAAAVDACPDAAWDRAHDRNRSWRVAYHALFYVHFYLQPTEDDFQPWEHHRINLQFLGNRLPWPPYDALEEGEPFTKGDLTAYLAVCRQQVDAIVPGLELDAESGFGWLPMSKLELQVYSLRHVMQHVGELYERLSGMPGVDLPWFGRRA